MTNHAELLRLIHPTAESTTLAAMRDDLQTAITLAEQLQPQDFYDPKHQVIFQAITNLLRGIEPIDASAIVAECRSINTDGRLNVYITPEFVDNLAGDPGRATAYAHTIKRLAWLRQMSEFAYWLVQELQERPEPDELFAAAQERWQMMQPKHDTPNFVYGWETIEGHEKILLQRIKEAKDGTLVRFDWPWGSWNRMIRPLRPGLVGIVAAPDGQGKSTYLEQIAEHWSCQRHTVFVHLENDLDYTRDRRLARHAKIELARIEDGTLTKDDLHRIRAANQRMAEFAPKLHYYHAAGLSMTEIVRELESRIKEGVCQAVVFDYLDKVQATRGQSKLFGDNTWERQAADMETLKTFAERNHVPVMTATQGNKAMQDSGTQTRRNIQGSGQKSQKAQLVIILTRDIVGEGGFFDDDGNKLADEGEYSPIVKVRIDKQNRGKTGGFQQYYLGQFFTVGDLQ